MTQQEQILEMLRKNEWTCTSSMYASYIADPRRRIFELKKKYELEWRWCESHKHQGNMKEWRLIGLTEIKKDTIYVLSGYTPPKKEQLKVF